MRLKVSNVCQLLDKSKFWGTTRNGVTFTNNGDGTFTINGTATNDIWLLQPVFQFQTSNPGYHTYLLDINQYSGNANAHGVVYFYDDNVNSSVALIGTQDSSAVIHKINGPIAGRGTIIQARFAIVVLKGVTVTNWTIRPQLFDLTEMYGAGNEPTTVAQFRQDFPNEMYEYSPVCWKKFRRLKYVTETKNLFDVNNAVPYQFANDNPPSDEVFVKDGIYTTRVNNYGMGSGLRIENGLSLPAGAYTLSVKIVDFNNIENFIIGFRYKTTDGTWKDSNWFYGHKNYKVGDIIAWTVTLPENTDVRLYLTYQNNNGVYFAGYVSYKDIQVEQGSTASPYQPYGYLPLNRGKYIANKEPVQLLDKSKYPATLTEGGVTFTNNGDGTITANGTSTKNYAHYSIIVPRPAIGHKILVLPNNNNNTQDHIYIYGGNDKGVWQDDIGYGGRIITITGIGASLKRSYTRIGINLNVNKDWVMNNHIYRPQLFDLTAMYGAGNEPTTVAQFRADFPNELYDYNPYNAITFR